MTAGKVWWLPQSLTSSIQGIAKAPLAKLRTAISQTPFLGQEYVPQPARISEQSTLTLIFQELWMAFISKKKNSPQKFIKEDMAFSPAK
jgi:hypothetical protein